MLKSLGLVVMSLGALVTAAYLPQGYGSVAGSDAAGSTPACGGCPTATAAAGDTQACAANTCDGAKATACSASPCRGSAGQCCSDTKTSTACSGSAQACAATSGECPSSCQKTTACGDQCDASAAGDCQQCPATKMTSAEGACTESGASACTAGGEQTAACGAKCDASAAGDCQQCPATKMTSAEGACTESGASACTAGSEQTAACGAKCEASAGSDCQNCPVTAAMAKLPQLGYQVGTEKVACPKAAEELAKSSGAKVQYVVTEQVYDTEQAAKLALLEATEQFVDTFAESKVCQQSGNITVAGQTVCCPTAASAIAKKALEAMTGVRLTYQVGDKQCGCSVEADKLAQESGDVKLCVVGDEKTACEVTARLTLARAKYRAAVLATLPAQSDSDSQGS